MSRVYTLNGVLAKTSSGTSHNAAGTSVSKTHTRDEVVSKPLTRRKQKNEDFGAIGLSNSQGGKVNFLRKFEKVLFVPLFQVCFRNVTDLADTFCENIWAEWINTGAIAGSHCLEIYD